MLWASPICTESSPAGKRRGRKKAGRGQLDLLADGPVAQAGFERTRATFHDVIRATEVHRYAVVLVENVPDVAEEWELFDWWVKGMTQLRPGYHVQYISVSSAHIGGPFNPWAAQWRDRLYLAFTRSDITPPDLDPRPLAWCAECGQDVAARQSWRKPGARRIGRYRRQYDYRCPNTTCRHALLEPYVLPAATIIDRTDLGQRIGDRTRPLAAATLARIEAGLAMFAEPTMLAVNHHDADPTGRAYPAGAAPLPTRTVKIGDGLACPPFTVPSGGTWRDDPDSLALPMPTRTTSETDGLVCPPFIAELRGGGSTARHVGDPLATVTAGGNHHGLTVPPGAFLTKNFGHLLAAVRETKRSGPRLEAFFGAMYFAALRPEEAAALNRRHLSLPTPVWDDEAERFRYGFGELHLDDATPHAGGAWTDDGKPRERRQLKSRATGRAERCRALPS